MKEESGFARNNRPLVEPSDRDGGRFHTHYQSRLVQGQSEDLGNFFLNENTLFHPHEMRTPL